MKLNFTKIGEGSPLLIAHGLFGSSDNWRTLGKQFAKSELTRNLATDYDFLGIIRRGEHITILYRVRSTKKEGEWLGRFVLGYEREEIKIFAAAIF